MYSSLNTSVFTCDLISAAAQQIYNSCPTIRSNSPPIVTHRLVVRLLTFTSLVTIL